MKEEKVEYWSYGKKVSMEQLKKDIGLNTYTGEVTKSKCDKCGAVANFDFECECVEKDLKKWWSTTIPKVNYKGLMTPRELWFGKELGRVSKLPFDRPLMPWNERLCVWLCKKVAKLLE